MMKRNLLIAASLLALSTVGASAADLGGNCCADLEERVAELEATAARKGNRKVSLEISGELNQAVMFWDDGFERNTYVVTNKSTASLFRFMGSAKIRPEISAGFRLEMEAEVAPSDNVDQFNDRRGSIGLIGDTTRRQIGGNSLGLSIRHANWWLEHKQLGRVTVGQQSQATDGIAEVDLGGTQAISSPSVDAWIENFNLRDRRTGLQIFPMFAVVGIQAELFRGSLDGGRANLVRYDSPTLMGFQLSAAWGRDDAWDIALRYFKDFGQIEFAAGVGYRDGDILDTDNFGSGLFGSCFLFGNAGCAANPLLNSNPINNQNIVGSASARHKPTGLFMTAAAGRREWDSFRPPANLVSAGLAGGTLQLSSEHYWYLKAGVFRNFFPIGKTSIYGEYYRIDDVGYDYFLANGQLALGVNGLASVRESSDMWGLGVVQHLLEDQFGEGTLQLYAAYRHYNTGNLRDPFCGATCIPLGATGNADVKMDMVMTGMRIRF
jgi:hypothetical protein